MQSVKPSGRFSSIAKPPKLGRKKLEKAEREVTAYYGHCSEHRLTNSRFPGIWLLSRQAPGAPIRISDVELEIYLLPKGFSSPLLVLPAALQYKLELGLLIPAPKERFTVFALLPRPAPKSHRRTVHVRAKATAITLRRNIKSFCHKFKA